MNEITNFKTFGDARRYCEKYGITTPGNTNIFEVAEALLRAYNDGKQDPLQSDMMEALENALTSIKRHGLWPIGPNGKPIIGNNTVRTVNEGLVIIDKIETILTKLKEGE